MNNPAKPKPSVPREALARLDDLARKYSLSRASVLREAIDLFEAEYDARDAYKRRGPYIARGDGDSPGEVTMCKNHGRGFRRPPTLKAPAFAHSVKVSALAALLAFTLGERARGQKHRAERMLAALESWYGESGVERVLLGGQRVSLVVRRHDWLSLKSLTPRESRAVKLGAVSQAPGSPYAGLGRYRPALYLIPEPKRSPRRGR
jgi:hypothetical protein